MLIGELSRRTGVSTRLLRYYEAQGLLTAERGTNGYRHYADDAVLTVRKIRVLLTAGLSTDVIRAVLPCTETDRPEFDWCAEMRDMMNRELAALDARIDNLREHRGTLSGFLAEPGTAKDAPRTVSAGS